MRPQAGVGKLTNAQPLQANDLLLVAQAELTGGEPDQGIGSRPRGASHQNRVPLHPNLQPAAGRGLRKIQHRRHVRRQRTAHRNAKRGGGFPAAQGARPPGVHHFGWGTEAEAGGIFRRAQMPELFQCVVARWAVHRIQHDHRDRLHKNNTSAMGEAGVGAGRVQAIPVRPRGPLAHGDRGLVVPPEGTAGNGLVPAIDAHADPRNRSRSAGSAT